MNKLGSVLGLCLLAAGSAAVPQGSGPASVAGIDIPRSPLAQKADAYIRSIEPDFLYNHSVRTYLFGALRLKAKGISYDPETAYVASLFHDLGLMRSMASPSASFEVDGASKAEEFVKAMHGREEFVLITEVVFAELTGGIAEGFEQFCNGGVLLVQADIGAGHSNFGQPGAHGVLSGDKGGATGGAALLGVIVGEGNTFGANTVDIWSSVAHLAPAVVTDVPPSNIVTPEDKDVWFVFLSHVDSP